MVPQDDDFEPLYRALRVARRHVQLVLDDHLDELGTAVGVPPRSEEDEKAAFAAIDAANVVKFGRTA